MSIDVKYNNQILFGPTIFKADKDYTYEVFNDVEPQILPNFISGNIKKHHAATSKTKESKTC